MHVLGPDIRKFLDEALSDETAGAQKGGAYPRMKQARFEARGNIARQTDTLYDGQTQQPGGHARGGKVLPDVDDDRLNVAAAELAQEKRYGHRIQIGSEAHLLGMAHALPGGLDELRLPAIDVNPVTAAGQPFGKLEVPRL